MALCGIGRCGIKQEWAAGQQVFILTKVGVHVMVCGAVKMMHRRRVI